MLYFARQGNTYDPKVMFVKKILDRSHDSSHSSKDDSKLKSNSSDGKNNDDVDSEKTIKI